MNRLFVISCVACLALVFAAGAFARDARLDYLVSLGKVTEADIAAAETEGPNTWMARQAYDIYIGGYVQPRWTYTDDGDPDNAFAIRRARVTMWGNMNETWNFLLQYDFVPSAIVIAGVRAHVGDGQIGLGQFLTPLVLESYTSSGALDTIERARCVTMSGDWGDPGLFVWYPFLDGKIDVTAAITNGAGPNVAEENSDKALWLRVNAMPFKGSGNAADGLMIGGAYNTGKTAEFDDEELDLGDYDRDVWVATVQWVYEAWKVQAEYVNIQQDVAAGGTGEIDGWYAYALYSLPLDGVVLAPVVKYETLDPNAIATGQCGCIGGEWITLGVRLSFVGTHDVKLEANYILENRDEGEDNDQFIIQSTVNF
ncbi:MAG: hypothetical protein JW889_08960 [Verrucomicrobia bacterium]|nr:hypothetical protein [Verrucomicrobiota bacterium]